MDKEKLKIPYMNEKERNQYLEEKNNQEEQTC